MKWDTDVFGLKELGLISIAVIFIISWIRSKNIDLDDDFYNYDYYDDNDDSNNQIKNDDKKKGD